MSRSQLSECETILQYCPRARRMISYTYVSQQISITSNPWPSAPTQQEAIHLRASFGTLEVNISSPNAGQNFAPEVAPPTNTFRPIPPANALQLPPLANALRLPPPANILQLPPPANTSQLPPPANTLQLLPPANALQLPLPANAFQPQHSSHFPSGPQNHRSIPTPAPIESLFIPQRSMIPNARPPFRYSYPHQPRQSLPQDMYPPKQCPLCFGQMSDIGIISCGHYYDFDCLRRWVSQCITNKNMSGIVTCPECPHMLKFVYLKTAPIPQKVGYWLDFGRTWFWVKLSKMLPGGGVEVFQEEKLTNWFWNDEILPLGAE